MKKLALLTLIFILALAQGVQAGDLFDIIDVYNANGSVALKLISHIGAPMWTNHEDRNLSVLKFYVNGNSTNINEDKSANQIPFDIEKIVVLDKSWPTSGYYEINVTYTDDADYTYEPETTRIFAKSGLSKLSVELKPEIVLTNESFILTLKIKAGLEDNAKSIVIGFIKKPKYFILDKKVAPTYISKGEEKDFVLYFNKSGRSLPDTIIFTTDHITMQINYTYENWTQYLKINESIIVYSSTKINSIPHLDAKLEVPSVVKRGDEAEILAYAWNTNIGGHKACDVNFTLTANSSAIEIPIHTHIPGVDLNTTDIEPLNPIVKIKFKTSSSTPLGKYKLTLTTSAKDCDWRSVHKIEKEKTFRVVEEIVAEPEPVDNDTGTTPPAEPISEEPQTIEEQEEGKEAQTSFLFYLGMGGVAALVVFMVVYFLIIRSQYI